MCVTLCAHQLRKRAANFHIRFPVMVTTQCLTGMRWEDQKTVRSFLLKDLEAAVILLLFLRKKRPSAGSLTHVSFLRFSSLAFPCSPLPDPESKRFISCFQLEDFRPLLGLWKWNFLFTQLATPASRDLRVEPGTSLWHHMKFEQGIFDSQFLQDDAQSIRMMHSRNPFLCFLFSPIFLSAWYFWEHKVHTQRVKHRLEQKDDKWKEEGTAWLRKEHREKDAESGITRSRKEWEEQMFTEGEKRSQTERRTVTQLLSSSYCFPSILERKGRQHFSWRSREESWMSGQERGPSVSPQKLTQHVTIDSQQQHAVLQDRERFLHSFSPPHLKSIHSTHFPLFEMQTVKRFLWVGKKGCWDSGVMFEPY